MMIVWCLGLPEEHSEVQPELNTTAEALEKLQFATQAAGNYLAISLAYQGNTRLVILAAMK